MSEEERRRCIILGICGGPGGQAAASGEGGQVARREALREHMQSHTAAGTVMGDGHCDDILSLIDEARKSAQ